MAEEQGGMTIEGSPPSNGEDRGSLRAAVLADWGSAASEPEAPAPAPEPAPEAPAEPATDTESAPEGIEEPTHPTESANEEEPEADPPAVAPSETVPDVEQQKRLDAVQRAEKRAKDQVARERLELESQKTEVAKAMEEIKRFQELQRRARFDPASVLSALGLTEEDFEPAARQIYSRSTVAAKDPRTREAAERAMREREQHSTVSVLQEKVEQLSKQIAERDQREQQDRWLGNYLSTAQKAVGDETPIVRNMLAKNQSGTQQRLQALASQLYQETGEVPEPADVVRELEKNRRAELEEAGVDVAQVFKNTKNRTPAAGEKQNGHSKTLSNEFTTTTKPRSEPMSREELRAETLRGLSSGSFE